MNAATASGRLQLAKTVAAVAAAEALQFSKGRHQLDVQQKLPNEFVSEADAAVEHTIRRGIAETYPHDQVVGEELGGHESHAFWSVDPIDGTSNFLRGSPLWGISIAYVVEGRSDVGVIALPELGLTVATQRGESLTCNDKPVANQAPSDISVVGVGENSYWPPEEIGSLEAHLRSKNCGVAGFRCATVGLAFAALGRTDGYIEKRTNLWDIAAGRLLCEQAGLAVEDGDEAVAEHPSVWVRAVSGRIQPFVEPWWQSRPLPTD